MIQFFREQKLLAALLLVSILVILAGLIMIQYSKNIEGSASFKVEETTAEYKEAQALVNTMAVIATMADQKLQETQAPSEAPSMGDNIPQSSIDHVAALNGRVPEVGSNDWCEVMMVKKANEWTEEEKVIFAQNCI
ncbi:DUF3012 domain-containing protein [Cellvibrio sp. NN19]|uniref:DUF3012 domain-containing protein n=1 Tax=Cellvibrio chitinivorans TaxID=3102792 RepID=UPI002B414616|nr:DUF3012 domain-containing protein [Cellvibrio sp. NN19]